jgi:hypothetical protein
MQLHEHNQIAHVAITRDDGKGRAPDSTAYYEHVRAAGQIASLHAEAALTRRFGMGWAVRPDGMGFGIDGIGADLMAVFSHRRAEITKLVDDELVPRFEAEHGRPPNQRELAALQERATLRTRVSKGGVIDWDAAARGWQAKAAQKAGVDLASLYRRVTHLGLNGCAPRNAGTQLTRHEIARAAHKALEKCARESSKWTRADMIANLGRVLPRHAADPDGQARLLEDVADQVLAGEFGPVVCLESPEAAPVPASLRRADGRSVYQRHGGIKYATRVQLSREEKLVAQAGARGGPAMSPEQAGRALGADVVDLEATLHQPPGTEVDTTDSRSAPTPPSAATRPWSTARSASAGTPGSTTIPPRTSLRHRGQDPAAERRGPPAAISPPAPSWPRALRAIRAWLPLGSRCSAGGQHGPQRPRHRSFKP